jgi:hypothetical protein
MRNIVLFLAVLLALACVLIVNPWIWPNEVTTTHHPRVALAAAPTLGQGLPSTPPSSTSPGLAKADTVAHSVHGIPRRLGEIGADPGGEEAVAFVVSNRYRPHWTIEW